MPVETKQDTYREIIAYLKQCRDGDCEGAGAMNAENARLGLQAGIPEEAIDFLKKRCDRLTDLAESLVGEGQGQDHDRLSNHQNECFKIIAYLKFLEYEV